MSVESTNFEGLPVAGRGLRSELADLTWLQGRLLSGALRRGDGRARSRILTGLLIFIAVLPSVGGMSLGLLLLLRSGPPELADRVLAVGGAFLILLWMAAPLTARPFLEGISLPKLLPYPLSFAGLAIASILGNAVGLLGLATLPLLIAAVLGLSRGPLSLLAAILPAAIFFGLLLALESVATTLYDLLAEDRRLRGALTFLLFLLPLLAYLEQVGLPSVAADEAPAFFSPRALTTRLSSWLPGAWLARALRSAGQGEPLHWALASLGLLAALLLALLLALRLMRRLFLGELLRGRRMLHRKESRGLREARRIPWLSTRGSRQLAGLLRKDWLCFRRSPMSLRLSFLPILFGGMAYFLARAGELGSRPSVLGLALGGFAAFLVASIASNSFGLIDHVGIGSLLLSPAPRSLILASQGLLTSALVLGMAGITGLGGAIGSGSWQVLPAALAAALALGMILIGTAHISSVHFPLFVDQERGQSQFNSQALGASLLMMLAGPLLCAPPLAAVLLTGWLWPSALALAILGAFAYALTAYVLQQRLALRAMRRREPEILASIVDQA